MTPPAPSVPLHSPRCSIQSRVAEIVGRVGWFAGSLYADRLSGAEDTPDRVKLRAAQLRWVCGYGEGWP